MWTCEHGRLRSACACVHAYCVVEWCVCVRASAYNHDREQFQWILLQLLFHRTVFGVDRVHRFSRLQLLTSSPRWKFPTPFSQYSASTWVSHYCRLFARALTKCNAPSSAGVCTYSVTYLETYTKSPNLWRERKNRFNFSSPFRSNE